jgi:hypothetical protein
MTAIQRYTKALQEYQIPADIFARIFEDYENITDKAQKDKRAAFFTSAIERMESLLDRHLCHDIRDACACSKGGWCLKAMQKIARERVNQSPASKGDGIGQVTHMGNPVLNEDGTITAGVGDEGGFHCPCPVFEGVDLNRAVSKTYCYCCAGHFRYHYQIALGKRIRTKEVVSSALESQGKAPCRFIFEILD